MTVREWAEYWQEKYDAPTVRRTTYEAHRYVLENHIIPGLGERVLTELTADIIGEFLAERRAYGNRRNCGPLSEVTMGHIWRLLTRILDRAVEEGQLTKNPARMFHYSTVRQVKAETLTDREIESYLDTAEELGYLPIFLPALEQGLRQRELIALKWSDLNTRAFVTRQGYGEYLSKAEQGKVVCRPSDPAEKEMRRAADKLGELFVV